MLSSALVEQSLNTPSNYRYMYKSNIKGCGRNVSFERSTNAKLIECEYYSFIPKWKTQVRGWCHAPRNGASADTSCVKLGAISHSVST